MLILYLPTLPNLFISSNRFFGGVFRVFYVYTMSATKRDSFTSSFPIWTTSISFSCLIAAVRLPILCWIKVVRVSILVLFLILEEILSAFHYWVWCYLWACYIRSLLCWGTLPLYLFVENFCHEWMLNFVKCFFCIYSDDCIGLARKFIWVFL